MPCAPAFRGHGHDNPLLRAKAGRAPGPSWSTITSPSSSCQLNAEALSLSQRFGLDLATTLDVIHGTTATNGQLKVNWPNKVLAGDTDPGFTIDLAHKDLSLIVQAANAARVPVPVAAAAREAFSTARARGYGGQDFSSMVDVLCDLAPDREGAAGRRQVSGAIYVGPALVEGHDKPHPYSLVRAA